MTDSRPYRKALSVDAALAELCENAGTQFDGRCVRALVDIVRDAAAEQSPDRPLAREPLRAVARVARDVKAA